MTSRKNPLRDRPGPRKPLGQLADVRRPAYPETVAEGTVVTLHGLDAVEWAERHPDGAGDLAWMGKAAPFQTFDVIDFDVIDPDAARVLLATGTKPVDIRWLPYAETPELTLLAAALGLGVTLPDEIGLPAGIYRWHNNARAVRNRSRRETRRDLRTCAMAAIRDGAFRTFRFCADLKGALDG